MRLCFFVILIFGWLALPALAQDHLFHLRETEKSQLEKLLDGDSSEAVKEKAETEIARDYLKTYYLNCSSQHHPTLTDQHLIELCTCTTANINAQFSNEEIVTLFKEPPIGDKFRTAVLRTAFRPCMSGPVRDSVYDYCLTTGSIRSQIDKSYEVCGCMADGVKAEFLGRMDTYIDAYIDVYRDKYKDPVHWYMQSRNYEAATKSYLEKCVYWHVYGWGTKKR